MNKRGGSLFIRTYILAILLGLICCTQALGAEEPDELYNLGRFEEAEKAYAGADMNHPKDIRYRYNRGCAAYQNSDFQGATAAFSSVLRRSDDGETQFKAAYNLGNTAYMQGDFASAVEYYKRAIRHNPANEDAKYNLELALKGLQKAKEQKEQKSESGSQKGSDQEDKGEQSGTGEKEEGSKKPSQEDSSDQKDSEGKDQRDDQGKDESGQEGKSEQGSASRQNEGRPAEQDVPKNLSGALQPLLALPETEDESKPSDLAGSSIDKQRAEALLDNIKENRQRFLQFQVPEDKKRGVASGKAW